MQTLKQFLRRLARLLGLTSETKSVELVDLARKIEPQASLDTLALTASRSEILKEIIGHAHRAFTAGGVKTLALFTGAVGTDKVIAAEAIANELQRGLYRVDLSRVVSKYIGETEKNLRQLLSAAERADAILFFDEGDPLFEKRSEVKDSHDRYANIEINYLLQQLENYHGIAILTTKEEQPNDELRRRIRFVVDFPYPD